jgi:hypothetical protein
VRRLLALVAALLVAGCGGGDSTPQVKRGSPVDRYGEQALGDYGSVEAVRAELVPASDAYVAGLHPDALVHAQTAQDGYAQLLSAAVRAKDATLNREIGVAFEKAVAEIADGRNLRGVRTRLGYISGQLLDGALAELVPRETRDDPGTKAEVLRRLLDPLEAEYAAAGEAGADTDDGRQSAQTAYGLLGRSQALARSVGKDFGPQLDDVSDGLARVRELAYPNGVADPVVGKDTEAQAALDRVRTALVERFGLPAPGAG